MNDLEMLLEQLKKKCNEKQQKKYKIQIFINLTKILKEDEFLAVKQQIDETYALLNDLVNQDQSKYKDYKKSLANLQKHVRKTYGYTVQGQIRDEYTGIGIAIGVALGSPLVIVNPAFMSIGLPIGLAIGIGIGDKKEKEAVENGKVY